MSKNFIYFVRDKSANKYYCHSSRRWDDEPRMGMTLVGALGCLKRLKALDTPIDGIQPKNLEVVEAELVMRSVVGSDDTENPTFVDRVRSFIKQKQETTFQEIISELDTRPMDVSAALGALYQDGGAVRTKSGKIGVQP